MKRKEKLILENLEITDIAAEGKAIARYNNKVVFIPFAVPGDIVNVVVIKKNKNFIEAKVVEYVKHSDIKIEPFCKHFGVCGGCKWQNLPYSEQLKYKQNQVVSQLERIGKVTVNNILPIIGSQNQTYYRNKLEFTFTNKRWLYSNEENLPNETDYWACGYHIPNRYDKVFNVEECFLQSEISDKIRNDITDYCKKENIPFYDLKAHVGFLRNVIIRKNLAGEYMLIVSFAENKFDVINKILNYVCNKYQNIVSLYYAINSKLNDSLDGIEPILFEGEKVLIEKINELKFYISPKSFFQTNTIQTQVLYSKILEFCELTGNEVVYDLYSGTGTIGLFVSKYAKKVIGIEYVNDAVNDANENSKLNNINNAFFYSGDMKDLLNEEFIENNNMPDVIILDPPRNGIHKDVIETILKLKVKCIVYVSCNPATQARDINLMSEFYSVEKIQPVDMFPHTHHVENICLLKLI